MTNKLTDYLSPLSKAMRPEISDEASANVILDLIENTKRINDPKTRSTVKVWLIAMFAEIGDAYADAANIMLQLYMAELIDSAKHEAEAKKEKQPGDLWTDFDKLG